LTLGAILISPGRNIMPFEPVIDGYLRPAPPVEAIGAGAGADVDVLIGINADEANLFFVPTDPRARDRPRPSRNPRL
jgi:carboxylesterase type B